MEIGSVIREKRTAQGLTQEQVATALGVSAPAVSKWERGESFPEITLLPGGRFDPVSVRLPPL